MKKSNGRRKEPYDRTDSAKTRKNILRHFKCCGIRKRKKPRESGEIVTENNEIVVEGEETYTLHKPAKHHYPTSKTFTGGIGDTHQIDIVDMKKYIGENSGYGYMLTVIDCFSRKAWAISMKRKSGAEVKRALAIVFKDNIPKKIGADRGKEFLNSNVQKYLKDNKVKFYTLVSQFKAAIVERFNRTLKSRMFKVFTRRKTYKWIDILPKLVKAYNNSFHRTIKMTPNQVNKGNETDLFDKLYGDRGGKQLIPKFNFGDRVRLNIAKTAFAKGYTGGWTREIFKIYKVRQDRVPHIMYEVIDSNDEVIVGTFYEQELQLVSQDNQPLPIEKVIDQRVNNNRKEHLVKLKGIAKPNWVEKI
jgi:hypothetical protein